MSVTGSGFEAAPIPGPAPSVRASVFMIFVYLDEFGHIGPYFGRSGQRFNESPVFGLAGVVLPEHAVRRFATFFLKQKEINFKAEIEQRKIMAAKWEKKGTSFIRPKPMKEYVSLRRMLLRIIRKTSNLGGGTFYYGREKFWERTDVNPTGLYTTCLSHAIRKIDEWCVTNRETFIIVLDQHSSRKELLECAVKTMYGSRPCKALASPPFEVESYLNQNIQAADWVATLVGRIKAHEVSRDEFPDYEHIKMVFNDDLKSTLIASSFETRPKRWKQPKKDQPIVDSPFSALAALKR